MERATALIRQDTDYAIRALIHLAQSPDGRTTGHTVAEACHIPRSFVYKILKKVQEAELVSSRPGRKGGFRLARPPHEITLNDVVRAVQGPVSIRTCVMDARSCPFAGHCPVSAEWREAQRYLVSFLTNTTLTDLLKSLDKPDGRGHVRVETDGADRA